VAVAVSIAAENIVQAKNFDQEADRQAYVGSNESSDSQTLDMKQVQQWKYNNKYWANLGEKDWKAKNSTWANKETLKKYQSGSVAGFIFGLKLPVVQNANSVSSQI
jgi:hypothetical protein